MVIGDLVRIYWVFLAHLVFRVTTPPFPLTNAGDSEGRWLLAQKPLELAWLNNPRRIFPGIFSSPWTIRPGIRRLEHGSLLYDGLSRPFLTFHLCESHCESFFHDFQVKEKKNTFFRDTYICIRKTIVQTHHVHCSNFDVHLNLGLLKNSKKWTRF